MFVSTGKIVYDPPRGAMKKRVAGWAVINVDREITRYFRYFIERNPTAFGANNLVVHQPAWDAHISIIRGERRNDKPWGLYNNKTVSFTYEPLVKRTEKGEFFYVNARCPIITEIREYYGLRTHFNFHLTVGRIYSPDPQWLDRLPDWHRLERWR